VIYRKTSVRTNNYLSIVGWVGNGTAGATVGHGLNAAPGMVIYKNRTDSVNWLVWHKELGGGDKFLEFNLTNAVKTSSTPFNSTEPNSSVLTLGTNNATNGSSDNIIAYCFAPVEGYSAFGSYTGNGSTDGPFVYTGFRPSFVMVKVTNAAGQEWVMYDSGRDEYNSDSTNWLYANESLQENYSGHTASGRRPFDLLSNGFKVRASGRPVNGSTDNLIYIAFAENPFALNARAR